MTKIQEALDEYDEKMQLIGGCTDGGCLIVRPKGMHTNGGCNCYNNTITSQRFFRVTQDLMTKLREIAKQGE